MHEYADSLLTSQTPFSTHQHVRGIWPSSCLQLHFSSSPENLLELGHDGVFLCCLVTQLLPEYLARWVLRYQIDEMHATRETFRASNALGNEVGDFLARGFFASIEDDIGAWYFVFVAASCVSLLRAISIE